MAGGTDSFTDVPAAEDQVSISSVRSIEPSPETINKLVERVRALVLELLPVEVDPKDLNSPTSRIISAPVIDAFRIAAGDFIQALPYSLLRARAEFMWDADHNAADYDENYGRAIACEVLARRITHSAPPESLNSLLSARFRHRQIDGDLSDYTNALEMAIDANCTIFLSSSEAQDVVLSLWKGDLVQKNRPDRDIEYTDYASVRDTSGFWGYVDPTRLAVPRYQNFFRIFVWLLLLLVFSQAVQVPVEELNRPHAPMDEWEIVLYLLSFSFFLEDFHQLFKLLRLFSYRTFGFWGIVNVLTDSLLIAAFALRVAGLTTTNDGDKQTDLRTRSFQVLSYVGPLIWMKLVRVFDGYKYVGTMQICVARMLQESGIFFALLSILGLGFYQGLWALDLADGVADEPSVIVNELVQALLTSPTFDKYENNTSGLWLYYLWNFATIVLLLNVLISLFSSAYEDVIGDAEGAYLAFFADKTIGMIRAPDVYVYPAPFNLIEAILIGPLEFILPPHIYAKINRWAMGTLFFLPLCIIALYESTLHRKMEPWLRGDNQGPEDFLHARDPVLSDEEEDGLKISKVPFSELVKAFPDTRISPESAILDEIRMLRQELAELKSTLGRKDTSKTEH